MMPLKPDISFLFFVSLLVGAFPFLEAKSQNLPAVAPDRGDRIVFLGDGFMEGALPYGYLESAFASYWPAHRLSFRNIGWAGDTPRGTSRDHFTNPPTPYEHLFEQIAFADPDLTVICYGRYLAFEPVDSIDTFLSDMHGLIDSLSIHDTRILLLTPPPIIEAVSPNPDAPTQNGRLMAVNTAIKSLAAERGLPVVDLFAGLQALTPEEQARISDDGIYLNAQGYYHAARILSEELQWPPDNNEVVIQIGPLEEAGRSDDARLSIGNNPLPIEFTVDRLPLVSPENTPEINIAIEGLPAGTYQLEVSNQVIEGTEQDWAAGRLVSLPVLAAHFHALRQEVQDKNALFFHQYRPQNETYLVGFREYEQGQNARDLDLIEPFIQTRENEIRRKSNPPVIRGHLRAVEK